MSRTAIVVFVAALMAAVVVHGCDLLSSDPTPTLTIIAPQNGEVVNTTVAPETPVTLQAQVDEAPAERTTVSWTVGGEVVATGLQTHHTFGVGEHTVCATAEHHGKESETACVRFSIPTDDLAITITAPQDGATLGSWRNLSCRATVTLTPPRSYEVELTWTLNGTEYECRDEELMALAIPAVGAQAESMAELFPLMPEGEHTITARAEVLARGLAAEASAQVTLTPPSGYIAFAGLFPGGNEIQIFIGVEDDANSFRQVTNFPSGHEIIWPAISPDGTELAFTHAPPGTCGEVYVSGTLSGIASVTDPQVRLLSGANHASGCTRKPDWSPDGSRIVYMGEEGGRPIVYIVNSDGAGRERLLDRTCGEDPFWQPVPCYTVAQPYAAFHPGGEVVMRVLESYVPERFVPRNLYFRRNLTTGVELRLFSDVSLNDPAAEKPSLYDVSPDGAWVSGYTPFGSQRVMLLPTDGSADTAGADPFFTVGKRPRWPFFCGGGAWLCFRDFDGAENRNRFFRARFDGTEHELYLTFPNLFEVVTPSAWHPPN